MLRLLKAFLIMQVALFFSLVGLNNIIDYDTNFLFVEHVLKMDTVFANSGLIGRAITNASFHTLAYQMIIFLELLIAVILWVGSIQLFMNYKNAQIFHQKKTISNLGLCCGISLYLLGFIIIGGEWFAMWQSSDFNGINAATRFVSIQFFILLFVNMDEKEF